MGAFDEVENGSDVRSAKCSGGSLLTSSMSGSVQAAQKNASTHTHTP